MQGICFDRVFLHNPVLSPHPVCINSEAGTPENDIAVYICSLRLKIVKFTGLQVSRLSLEAACLFWKMAVDPSSAKSLIPHSPNVSRVLHKTGNN
jgi:hypothetical protein